MENSRQSSTTKRFSSLRLDVSSFQVVFDLKLARGLDYYTGMIFEAVLKENALSVGSVAAGGRYDELVEKLHPQHRRIPCVGLSIGVERIVALKEAQHDRTTSKIKTIDTEIFVASAEKHFLAERMNLCDELWRNGFKVTARKSSLPTNLSFRPKYR